MGSPLSMRKRALKTSEGRKKIICLPDKFLSALSSRVLDSVAHVVEDLLRLSRASILCEPILFCEFFV